MNNKSWAIVLQSAELQDIPFTFFSLRVLKDQHFHMNVKKQQKHWNAYFSDQHFGCFGYFPFHFCLSSIRCPCLLFLLHFCRYRKDFPLQYRQIVLSQIIPVTFSITFFVNKPERMKRPSSAAPSSLTQFCSHGCLPHWLQPKSGKRRHICSNYVFAVKVLHVRPRV